MREGDGEPGGEPGLTPLSRVMAVFPAFHLAAILAAVVDLSARPGVRTLATVLGAIYLLPLAVFRLHQAFHPVREGITYLDRPVYSAWWGSHQCQVFFVGLPGFEAALRLVPGLFSAWLRAWGSEVGEGVYWTPGIEIADRGLLVVGDGAVFGHRVGMYAHVIKPRPKGLMLFVKKVRIGAGAFVGAGCHVGPGVSVEAGAYVPAGTDLHPNVRWTVDGGAGTGSGDEG